MHARGAKARLSCVASCEIRPFPLKVSRHCVGYKGRFDKKVRYVGNCQWRQEPKNTSVEGEEERGNSGAYLHDHVGFHRRVIRERRHAHGGARVLAGFAENLDNEVGSTVHYLRHFSKSRSCIDVTR
jgi:hypothetical protein